MTTDTLSPRISHVEAASPSFERVAGLCGLAAGGAGFLYAVAFVVLKNAGLSALLLLMGGLLSTALLTALYGRLRAVDESVALLALLLGVTGALGAAIHGGYDLASALHPVVGAAASLPNPVDPRGLLTFGLTGGGVSLVAWLLGRTDRFPGGLNLVGYLLAILLVVIYLARLIVLDTTSPLLVAPVLLAGFIVNPLWNVMLGLALWRGAGAGRATA